jgi:nucleoside-diphosphate-sugar epimerase
MRVLILGDRGFIGSHLANELRVHGHQVTGHDRQEGDLTESGVFWRALQAHQPDRVIHLAAQVGRLFGEENLFFTIRQNVLMTALVANHCGEFGIPLVYASTSEVYGDRGNATCFEDGPLTPWGPDPLPHNAYGLTKRQGEEFCRLYAPDRLKIVRLSMPYGPLAPPGRGRRAMDNFLWQAHHRMPITVHRGAERSWCYVSDVVRGIRLVMERGEHEVYNVGRDDKPLSMLNLAVRACALAGAPFSLIREVDPPARQTVVKRLSTQRLRDLGWQPMVELDEGLERVLDWVRRFDAEGNYVPEGVAA